MSLLIAFGKDLPAMQDRKMATVQDILNDPLEVGVNVASWPGNEEVCTWRLKGRTLWLDRHGQPVGSCI